MSLTADNCKVIYLRLLWPAIHYLDPDILRLAATFKNDEFSIWIKPTKPFNHNTRIAKFGLKAENGELFLWGQMLQTTVDLKTALTRFYKFVTSSPGPVLLVTHSSGIELMLLSKAIRKIKMADKFEGVIQRVVDTVPIFEKRFPTLKGGSQLTLKALIFYLQRKQFKESALDISYELRWLIRLVTENDVSTSELIENSESFKEILLRPSNYLPFFYNPLYMRDLCIIMHYYTVRSLEKTGISISKLKELSQEDDPMVLHKYVNKQSVEKTGRWVCLRTTQKIFDFLKKRRAHDYGDHSVNTAQEGVVDEPGSSTAAHKDQHADYSLLGIQNRIIDEPNSVVEELETPSDSDHSCARQKAQCANCTSTGDQKKPSDILDSFNGDQRVRFYNDYAFSPEQEELIRAIDLYSEAVNDDRFTNQYDEFTVDLNSFFGEQEASYSRPSLLTVQEQEERVDELDSIMGEPRASYDNHDLLSTGQEGLAHAMDFFTEGQQATNAYLFPNQYDELTSELNSYLEGPEASYNKDNSLTRQPQESVDDVDFIVEETEAPYPSDRLLTTHEENRNAEVPLFNKERKAQYNADDSFVEGQEKPIDIMDLLREEEGAARAIDLYAEGQKVANCETFPDLISFAEDQEIPHNGTHSFDREHTEFVVELNSVTTDLKALYEHSLTKH